MKYEYIRYGEKKGVFEPTGKFRNLKLNDYWLDANGNVQHWTNPGWMFSREEDALFGTERIILKEVEVVYVYDVVLDKADIEGLSWQVNLRSGIADRAVLVNTDKKVTLTQKEYDSLKASDFAENKIIVAKAVKRED